MVLDIRNDYVEINFSMDNGGIRPVMWHDICKDIDIGDFVQVMSGADTGVTGWVDNVHKDNVSVHSCGGTILQGLQNLIVNFLLLQ